MVVCRLLYNVNVNLTICVCIVAGFGDFLITVWKSPLGKALCDNITHALIGGLSWSICYLNRDKTLKETRLGAAEILSCTLISSVIDLDHFIAAKSILLKNATSLTQRPFLHCSTIPLVLFPTLLLISYVYQLASLKHSALIGFTAFATHHIRDATRRGFWFYPYGSTEPISYSLYIAFNALVPYGVIFMDKCLKLEQLVRPDGFQHVV